MRVYLKICTVDVRDQYYIYNEHALTALIVLFIYNKNISIFMLQHYTVGNHNNNKYINNNDTIPHCQRKTTIYILYSYIHIIA